MNVKDAFGRKIQPYDIVQVRKSKCIADTPHARIGLVICNAVEYCLMRLERPAKTFHYIDGMGLTQEKADDLKVIGNLATDSDLLFNGNEK